MVSLQVRCAHSIVIRPVADLSFPGSGDFDWLFASQLIMSQFLIARLPCCGYLDCRAQLCAQVPVPVQWLPGNIYFFDFSVQLLQ